METGISLGKLKNVSESELTDSVHKFSKEDHLSHDTRKAVFGVPDQVRLNPDCSAIEIS